MKIFEVTLTEDTGTGKLVDIKPGAEATIDMGNGTKTVVDLKQNPTALVKSPDGKIMMNQAGITSGGVQPTAPDPASMMKPGEPVFMTDKVQENEPTIKTIRGPHGRLDVDRGEKGVTRVRRQHWGDTPARDRDNSEPQGRRGRSLGTKIGASGEYGGGVGVPHPTGFSDVHSDRAAGRRQPRLDRDDEFTESSEQRFLVHDYDRWSDRVKAAGGQVHQQRDRNHLVAQSWDGTTVGEFHLGKNQGWVCGEHQDVLEDSDQLSIQDLATISDEALDKAYHYGRSTPGKSFGWQANLKSAEYAKQMIDAGETDIEKISDAIHKGWNVTARAFVKNPDQFDDTEKLRAAGKLEAKLQQRAKLMTINYGQLPNEEQEKDRVVARALLQAINNREDNDQDVAEAGSLAQQAAIAINMKKHHKKPKGVAEGDDDLDKQALDVADKLTTDKNLAKLNDMAHDSTIYRALERYFAKNNISTTIFNRVAAIVFKKLDKYGRRLSTDPRIQEQGVAEQAPPINVPQGWEAKTQADGSTRISKIGSMSSADYKQNMADYKAKNWTPEKMADYSQRMASGQGYTDAEKFANYKAGVSATGREDPETLSLLIPDENVRNQLQQQHKPLDEQGMAEGADDITQAKERLAQLEKQFDHSYEYSDDHREWRKHRDIYLEIQRLKKLISQNEPSVSEDWQKVNKRDKTDGMSSKAVKAYRRENPGSKLKTAVTTKPSKLKKGSKSAKRRKSFCARMSGMKRAHASAKTKRDPNSPINKALRRWNCESVEDMKKLLMIAEQKIAKLKSQPNKV